MTESSDSMCETPGTEDSTQEPRTAQGPTPPSLPSQPTLNIPAYPGTSQLPKPEDTLDTYHHLTPYSIHTIVRPGIPGPSLRLHWSTLQI